MIRQSTEICGASYAVEFSLTKFFVLLQLCVDVTKMDFTKNDETFIISTGIRLSCLFTFTAFCIVLFFKVLRRKYL